MEAAAAETDGVKAPNPQRERQRTWYASLTPEQKEARRVRQAEAQRIRRAKTKAGIYTGRNTVDPAASVEKRRKRQREWMARKREQQKAKEAAAGAPRIDLQPLSKVLGSARPTGAPKAPQTKPAKLGKPKSERAQRREYRATLAEYLEDCLTDPSAPTSGEIYERCRMTAFWMGWFEKLDRLEASADGKPDLLSELRISIALECLRRLADMKPAAASALPGIASSFEHQGIRPKYPG